MNDITLPALIKILPTNLKSSATQELVDTLNNISTDPEATDIIRENFISYAKILQEGKYKVEDYLNAVKFVSYRLMEHTKQEAYIKTFPNRYARLVAAGTDPKTISSYVAAYSKNKLVNALMEQTLIPFWLINQGLRQEALNTQVELMRNANSEKVRCDAANSVLAHLEKPKEAGPLINIDMRESKGLQDLRSALSELATAQLTAIKTGTSVVDIASHKLSQEVVDI